MRRLSLIGGTLALVLAGGWTASAQDLTSDEGDPTLAGWQWMQEVRLPANKAAYVAITLPPNVLGKAQDNLGDLRLADDAGTRLPFAVRELRTTSIQQQVPIQQQSDAGPVEAKGYYEVSLELGDVGENGHNEIEIDTDGRDFRRKVEVLGDSRPDFDEARQLLGEKNYLVHYEVDGAVVDIRRLHYAPNRVRFLKVRVYADPSNGEKIPKINKVTVRYAAAIQGRDVTNPATLDERQAVRGDGGPGSAWYITLDVDPVPCGRLILGVDGGPVERPFRVEIADPGLESSYVATRSWTWKQQDGRWLLTIDFPREVRARRLKLTVTDFANAPMSFFSAQYSAAARQVIFAWPDAAKYKGPLRLYFGNPQASPANYDFARKLPLKVTPPPQPAELAGLQTNPQWVAPEPALAERMPWLIYTMLGLTSVALLVVLGLLARTALRRHDSAQPAATR
jgi:hypothetical protein